MKKVKLIGGVCLVLVLVVALSGGGLALADKPESPPGLAKKVEPVEAEMPLPPSIMPVVIVSGSDYEMGYQYGQQAGQYIEMMKDAAWVSVLKKLGSEDAVLHELKAWQYFTRLYAPEAIDILKGMADGATDAGYPLSYIDALLLNAHKLGKPGPTWTYPEGAEDDELPPEECSIFSAWGGTTADGSLICGNSDDNAFTYSLALVAFPDDGNSYIALPRAGQLTNDLYMNNKGLFMSGSGGYARRPEDSDYGFSIGAVQHMLRFADSAEEAKDMLLSWPTKSSSSRQISDVNGDVFVVESSHAFKVVRQPGEWGTGEEEYGEDTSFIYQTNNYFSDEGHDAILAEKWIDYAGWLGRSASISSIPRNLFMWNMLHNYQGEVDLDFVKMMWRFIGDPPPYPMGGYGPGEPYWDTQGEGWNQVIGNLDNRSVSIALPDDGDNGKAYICTGSAARVAYPLVPVGGDFYQIAGTHTFYELTLASGPAAVVSAAKSAAHAYIAEAYHELMWLEETDPVYLAWNEVYSTANAEYYEGINWANKAALADGDEALSYYAKAATAFTRSQAHAKQVYNALVPPATCPSDLGLREWFGEWGEWAERGF